MSSSQRCVRHGGVGEVICQWRVPEELELTEPEERERQWYDRLYSLQLVTAVVLLTVVFVGRRGPSVMISASGTTGQALCLVAAWMLLVPPPKKVAKYLTPLRGLLPWRTLRASVHRNGITARGGWDMESSLTLKWSQAACVALAAHPTVEGVTVLVVVKGDGRVAVIPMASSADTAVVETALRDVRGETPVARIRRAPRHQTGTIEDEMLYAWPSPGRVKVTQGLRRWKYTAVTLPFLWYVTMSSMSPLLATSLPPRPTGGALPAISRHIIEMAGPVLMIGILVVTGWVWRWSERAVVCAHGLVLGNLTIPWTEVTEVHVRVAPRRRQKHIVAVDWDCEGAATHLEVPVDRRLDTEEFAEAVRMARGWERARE